jgi:hypothetical protein
MVRYAAEQETRALKKIIPIAVLCLALLALGLPAARRALAAPTTVTFTVNSILDVADDQAGDGFCHTEDAGPAHGACTLRAAVMEADQASGAGATISLPAGTYSLTIPAAGLDGPLDGDLNLTAPASGNPVIEIDGAGAASTIIDANQVDRVLAVTNGRTAIISGVTLRGGLITDGSRVGGGIANAGTLSLDHSTVSGNQNPGSYGGGIENGGTMTLTDSTIGPDNTANDGAGLSNEGGLVLDRSTVYGNSGNYGGGVFNDANGNLVVINSTLSDNNVVYSGGGIYNRNIANVYNTTIFFNGADSGRNNAGRAGGVYNAYNFNLRNTLLAGNFVGNQPVYDDCFGTLTAYGEDLLGEASPCTINQVGAADVLNSLSLIGPLQANLGPTLTRALLAGSNAIDTGSGCTDDNSQLLATDQRGRPRVVGLACDVGAFEYSPLNYLFLPLTWR